MKYKMSFFPVIGRHVVFEKEYDTKKEAFDAIKFVSEYTRVLNDSRIMYGNSGMGFVSENVGGSWVKVDE